MPNSDDNDDEWQILSNRHMHDAGAKIGEGLSGVEKNKVTGKS